MQEASSQLAKTRLFVIRVALGFVGLIVVYYLFVGLVNLATYLAREETPVAITYNPYLETEETFGPLELPPISGVEFGPDNIIGFGLDTALPAKFPEVVYVYKVIPPKKTFQTVNRAINKGESFGVDVESPKQTLSQVIWEDEFNTLTFNTLTEAWNYSALDIDDKGLLETPQTPETLDKTAVFNTISSVFSLAAKNFEIEDVSQYDFDFNATGSGADLSRISTSKLLLREQRLSAALSESPATSDFLEENPINETSKLVFSNPLRSNLEVEINLEKRVTLDNLIYLNYEPIFFEEFNADTAERGAEDTSKGIYQILDVFAAYEKLQLGGGKLITLIDSNNKPLSSSEIENLSPVTSITISAEKTDLRYFVSDQKIGFTFPVFYFEGSAVTQAGDVLTAIFYVDALSPNISTNEF